MIFIVNLNTPVCCNLCDKVRVVLADLLPTAASPGTANSNGTLGWPGLTIPEIVDRVSATAHLRSPLTCARGSDLGRDECVHMTGSIAMTPRSRYDAA